MNEISVFAFQRAIRETHGAEAEFAERISVDEHFEGQPVWEGEVLVFDLLDHPSATRCYAWAVDGKVTAVLHEPPVDSPRMAVRAAIAQEHLE